MTESDDLSLSPRQVQQVEGYFPMLSVDDAGQEKLDDWVFTCNHRALRVIKAESGLEPFVYLVDEQPGLFRIQLLSYAMTESYRRANKMAISFDEFVDGPYLPRYMSTDWRNLAKFLDGLIVQTFPEVVLMRRRPETTKASRKKAEPD